MYINFPVQKKGQLLNKFSLDIFGKFPTDF